MENAARLYEIQADELKMMDRTLFAKLKPGDSQATVPLEMTLTKLVKALTPVEEATLLTDLQGAAIGDYKRSVPSVAFLGEWPDEKLKLLMAKTTADETCALLRMRPDLNERLVALCPGFTAELVVEELGRDDKTSENEKSKLLEIFNRRIQEMVTLRELDLESLFDASGDQNRAGLSKEAEQDGTKKSA